MLHELIQALDAVVYTREEDVGLAGPLFVGPGEDPWWKNVVDNVCNGTLPRQDFAKHTLTTYSTILSLCRIFLQGLHQAPSSLLFVSTQRSIFHTLSLSVADGVLHFVARG